MVRRSFSEPPKTAFIPLHCSIVRSHLGHAMEVSTPNLKADITHLRRVQQYTTRLVRDLHPVLHEERLRQVNIFSLECVECGRFCHCRRPPTSFRWLLVQAISRNRRAKSSAPLSGRPCPLYATIFHTEAKGKIIGERMQNEQD